MNTRIYENILNKHVQVILANSDYELKKMIFQAENLIRADGYLWYDIISQTVSSEKVFENGMILAGPDCCGKHTAAAAAIKHFLDKNGISEEKFAFVHLTGKDFMFSEKLIDADMEYRAELDTDDYCLDIVHMHIERLLNLIEERFGDDFSGKSIVVLMDEINKSSFCTQIYDWVAFYLNQLYLDFHSDEQVPRMYVFVLTQDASEIPHSLREKLTLLKMERPDENERKLFVKNLSNSNIYGFDEPTIEILINESTDMTYMELRDFMFAVSKIENADEIVIKKLAKDMLTHPATNTGVVPAVSDGGDNAALLAAVDKLIDKKTAANPVQQPLMLNTLSDDLKDAPQGLEMERPDEEKIIENAKNGTWDDLFKSFNVNIDELLDNANQ